MKKTITALISLCLCLCLGCTAAVAGGAPSYTTEWDLTQIYADQAAFDADYAAVEAALPRYEALRGTLSTPQGMLGYLALENELYPAISRLNVYALLLDALDATDATAKELAARIAALGTQQTIAKGFVDSELGAMTLEERAKLADAPELAAFAHNLRSLKDEHAVYYSEETTNVMATLQSALFDVDTVFQTLLYADLPNPVYVTPEGEEVELTESAYSAYVYGDTPREELIKMVTLLAKRYQPYENTFAATLDAHMKAYHAMAELNSFDSTLAYAMHDIDVDPSVYGMLIKAGHAGAPDKQRYSLATKRGLGLENDIMYSFDGAKTVTNFAPELPYGEGCEKVLEALAILGDDYVAVVRELLESGHVDAFPADDKQTGAFSCDVDGTILPYILMNYMTGADARTLAHELGHSLYSRLCSLSQPPQYRNPANFTHEVASTTNEFLYLRHMYDHAASDDERLYYLQAQIGLFNLNFFTQMFFAEFEDYCYKTVEEGGTLMAEALNAEYERLDLLYSGDVVYKADGAETGWCSIPHFYYNYYVYQYASSTCYASAIAARIYAGEPGAKESYRAFLDLGSSVSPMDALAVAGVDPLDESTYQAAMAYYKELVDQYEAIIDAM